MVGTWLLLLLSTSTIGFMRPGLNRISGRPPLRGLDVGSRVSRRRPPVFAQQTDEPRSWFDQVRAALFEMEEEASPELQSLADFLTSAPGFSLRMALGSEPARGAGGSGSLARKVSPTVALELPVAFKIDLTPALDPFQGDVRILKDSKFFTTPPCFWLAEYERADDLVPKLWQMRLGCKGIDASGEGLLPEGQVFFNAKVGKTRRGEWELNGGTITVKETVPGSRGILAELKIVGTFDVFPLDAAVE